jgi:hypothetical protein
MPTTRCSPADTRAKPPVEVLELRAVVAALRA